MQVSPKSPIRSGRRTITFTAMPGSPPPVRQTAAPATFGSANGASIAAAKAVIAAYVPAGVTAPRFMRTVALGLAAGETATPTQTCAVAVLFTGRCLCSPVAGRPAPG
jgi:hypothetical protein